MSSQFDMNATQRCRICLDNHPKTTRCSYDLLVNYVMTLRMENVTLMQRIKEAYQSAREFQRVIRGIEPELSRLVAIELKYKVLIGEDIGTEKLCAEASKSECEDLQLSFGDRGDVQSDMGSVQTPVPGDQ